MQTIPGLERDHELLREVAEGGTSLEWMEMKKIKYYTNAFIFHEKKILLGFKKRGVGLHKYNGFGGKIEPGETALQAAGRELEEEAGIKSSLKHIGVLLLFNEVEETAAHIDVYRGDGFEGTVTESDEMRPKWFSLESESGSSDTDTVPPIPFDQQWETDPHWFPLLLANKQFRGRADYRLDGGKLLPSKWWFGAVEGTKSTC
ncbi:NUDIX hydrolase domain-like protein [Lentinula raphanica]|nr:NUDIX hydrolase domain-like protein [Lentinula raphanica]